MLIYPYTHIHTPIHLYTHTLIFTCPHPYTHIHTPIHLYTHTTIHSYSHAHTHTLISTHPYTHISTHSYMYIHIPIHPYCHIHMPSHPYTVTVHSLWTPGQPRSSSSIPPPPSLPLNSNRLNSSNRFTSSLRRGTLGESWRRRRRRGRGM